jgi:predicted NAD/FAD-binding protein
VDVTLFEAQRRLGGHTDSHSVWVEDKVYTIDTGFVAFHPSGHASFCQWLSQIGVPTQRTDLTFSVRADHEDLEYSTIGWRTFFLLQSAHAVADPLAFALGLAALPYGGA